MRLHSLHDLSADGRKAYAQACAKCGAVWHKPGCCALAAKHFPPILVLVGTFPHPPSLILKWRSRRPSPFFWRFKLPLVGICSGCGPLFVCAHKPVHCSDSASSNPLQYNDTTKLSIAQKGSARRHLPRWTSWRLFLNCPTSLLLLRLVENVRVSGHCM